MIPDWEKRSWEFKLSSEDGHRYPTLASLESISKEKHDIQNDGIASPFTQPPGLSPEPQHLSPVCPARAHSPEFDPHPLEPLFRRPSTRQPIDARLSPHHR